MLIECLYNEEKKHQGCSHLWGRLAITRCSFGYGRRVWREHASLVMIETVTEETLSSGIVIGGMLLG